MRPDFDRAILGLTDVLIPNETEFVAIARLLPATAALAREKPYINFGDFTEAALPALAAADLHRLCRALGVPTVIVTLGGRGCFVSQAGGGTLIPGHAMAVVDTTGAGDAFVGGFAAGLVKGRGDVVAAARYANAIAALSVTKPGTAPAMPRQAEIARFLRGPAKK
jgi:ribokinase